ncbi:MAG: hypothetical protein ACJAWV_003036 [Flammeovirgaceae bacterium]
MSKKTFLSILKYVISISVAGFLFWWLYRGEDMEKTFEDIKEASPFWISTSIGIALFSHWSRASRWVIALRPLGYETRTFTAFLAVMFGYFVNLFVPRLGEVMRCGLFYRTEKVPINISFGSVLAERALDFIILVALCIVVFFVEFDRIGGFILSEFNNNSEAVTQKIYILLAICSLAFLGLIALYLLRNKLMRLPLVIKGKGFVLGMKDGLLSIKKLSRKQRLAFILHTLNIWAMYYFMSYVLFLSMPATSNLSLMTGCTVLIMSGIAMVIPSPGGIGTYHFFVTATLIAYGLEEGIAKNSALLMHSVQYLATIIIGGLSFLISIFIARKQGENIGHMAEDVVGSVDKVE